MSQPVLMEEKMHNMLHELSQEFPEHNERMQLLRATDADFAELYNAYHETNQAVLRAESDEEPTDDNHLNELRHARVRLKDSIYSKLTSA